VGAALYLASCVLALVLRTPVGSNAERYGCCSRGRCCCARGSPRPRAWPGARGAIAARERARGAAGRIGALGAVALIAWAVWCAWGPIRETAATAGERATSAAYYAPLERFLAQRAAVQGPVRIEVPLTRSHWEAALLAPHVSLARGWEKQLDERYDGVLLARGLDASSYRRWLEAEAVSYVALPDARLTPRAAPRGG